MNAKPVIACFVFCAATAHAQEPVQPLPTAQAPQHVVDCAQRSLPSQREVGGWTGQSNFSQVYATRARLMGEVGRACQKPGVRTVELVVAPDGRSPRRIVAQAR